MTHEKDVAGAYFGAGSDAQHEQGVLYHGDYQHEGDGTSVAIRLHARALASQGVPVLLKAFTATVLQGGVYQPMHVAGVAESVRAEVGELTNASISKLFPLIRHFVVHKHEDISRKLMRGALGGLDSPELLMKARSAIYSYSVLYSVWERDRISEAMSRELQRMGDNWVPCEQNAQMLRSCGVHKVYVVPHPYDPASPMLHLVRRKPYKNKRFYFIGRWEPRKNPAKILRAFAAAFNPGGAETLTMKHHGAWEDYPSFDEVVDEIVQDGKWTREQLLAQVTSVVKHLRPDQIVKLHFDNNIYVGPSAGEAWCLPAFDAKLSGNTLIHTPYGGTQDFCDRQRDLEVSFQLENVPESYGWPEGSQWAGVSEEHLTSLMRDVAVPEEFTRPEGFDRFSLESVGKRMVDRIREVWGEGVRW